MTADEGSGELIYEVECTLLDPEVVAAFDAWLPEHVRAVTACEGFTGAEIQVPGTDADGPPIRRTQAITPTKPTAKSRTPA